MAMYPKPIAKKKPSMPPAKEMLSAKKKPTANTKKPGMVYMNSTAKPVKKKK